MVKVPGGEDSHALRAVVGVDGMQTCLNVVQIIRLIFFARLVVAAAVLDILVGVVAGRLIVLALAQKLA